MSSCDVYRPLRLSDCEAIASHYNQNRAHEDPIWCANGESYSGIKIWGHFLTLQLRGHGQAITQVHEQDRQVLSYFGGYFKNDAVNFSIGLVDLSQPDPMMIWRQDTAQVLKASLDRGVETVRIQASSDRGQFVDWMEQEVGMKRLNSHKVWVANRELVAQYTAKFMGTSESELLLDR